MAGDHTEAIRAMEGRLEIISEQIRSPCQGEDHKQLVKELLKECQDQRNQMESIALEVIDKEGGDISFNRITTQLEQLDELHKSYEAWANGSGAPPAGTPMSQSAVSARDFGGADNSAVYDFGPSPSPGASYLASTSEGGIDDRPHRHASHASDATSDAGRRRDKKSKKDRHKKQDAEDFGFPAQAADSFGGGAGDAGGGGGGFGGWPGAGETEVNTGWGSDAGTRGMAAGGDWGSSGAAGGGFEGGSWGAPAQESQAPSFSHGGGFPDAAGGGGGSGSAFGDSGGGWGTSPSTMPGSSMPGAFGGTFEDSGGGSSAPFGTTKPQPGGIWGGLDAPSSQGGLGSTESQLAQLHIKQPWAEIADDIDGFKMHFIRNIAAATGVAPHRIKVTNVRPHAY